MPNWCFTNINISSENKKGLDELFSLLEDWTSEERNNENGFGHNWLGNIVLNSKIGTVDTGKKTDCRCRGEIVYMDNLGGEIVIQTETAWAPIMDIWKRVVDKYLPGAEITYSAEESGCEIYYTNDPCLQGLYYVDVYTDNDSYTETEFTQDAVIDVLRENGISEKEIENFANSDKEDFWFEIDGDDGYGISVHAWAFMQIEELVA